METPPRAATSPPRRAASPARADSGGLGRFLTLTWALTVREFKGRYRRSALGPAWALIQPLCYTAVFVFMRGVLDIESEGIPYPLFVLSALTPWTFFSVAVARCAPSVYSNASVVKKTAMPREAFPLAGVAVSLVDFGFAFALLAGLAAWYGAPVSLGALLWLPVLVALTAALALGVGLAAAAIGTFRNDVNFAIPFAMQIWMFASPVVYPASQVPERWRWVAAFNPVTGPVEGFRSAIARGVPPDPQSLLISGAWAVAILAIAWPVFRYVSQYFADVL